MKPRFLLLLALLSAACARPRVARETAPMNRDRDAAPLRKEVFTAPKTGLALPYRLFVPPSCTPDKPCGLLLFLHGSGERGSDNEAQLANHALAFTGSGPQSENPTIVVYPQCPQDMQWVNVPWGIGNYPVAETPISQPLAAALALVESLRARLPVDPARILVTGLSMGGYGTWDLVVRQPGLFAGALPLCGGADPSLAAAIRHLPVWAFHGENDPVVPARGTRRMIEALRAAGGTPRYSEVAGHGHDIWTVAYQDPQVVRWLLSQRREIR